MPAVKRKLVGGPSEGKLFEALQRHAEGKVVSFDVEQTDLRIALEVDSRSDKTTQELKEEAFRAMTKETLLGLAIGAMPYYPTRVNSITAADTDGEWWLVDGVLEGSLYTSEHLVKLKILFCTKGRDEGEYLLVSWE